MPPTGHLTPADCKRLSFAIDLTMKALKQIRWPADHWLPFALLDAQLVLNDLADALNQVELLWKEREHMAFTHDNVTAYVPVGQGAP